MICSRPVFLRLAVSWAEGKKNQRTEQVIFICSQAGSFQTMTMMVGINDDDRLSLIFFFFHLLYKAFTSRDICLPGAFFLQYGGYRVICLHIIMSGSSISGKSRYLLRIQPRCLANGIVNLQRPICWMLASTLTSYSRPRPYSISFFVFKLSVLFFFADYVLFHRAQRFWNWKITSRAAAGIWTTEKFFLTFSFDCL